MDTRVTAAFAAALVAVTGDLSHLNGQQAPAPESALARYALNEPAADWRLPNRLREISGLALTPDGRLLAHDDERAVVYEIDFEEGEFVKGWAFGDPPARADFEGIAVAADRVWLVTSDGRLYEGTEGEDDERVLFNTYGTGVGRDCEVEGLAYEPRDETLLLACKTPRIAELEGLIAVYRWSIEERSLLDPPLLVDKREIDTGAERSGFSASGIERDPVTGHYLLIAAREERIIEIDTEGRVIAVHDLSRQSHPQPEGVAISEDRTLFVADEGANRRARLKLYAPRAP